MYIFRKNRFTNIFFIFFLLFVPDLYGEKILPYSLELEGVSLHKIAKKLEKACSVTIRVEKTLEDPIDVCFAKDQSLEEVLEMLAEVSETELNKISEEEYILSDFSEKKSSKTKEYLLKYLSSDDLIKNLKDLYGEKAKCTSLIGQNKILVLAEQEIISEIDELIGHLDLPQRQVKIQSQILDISKDLFQELGFDWLYNKPANLKKQTGISLLSEESSGEIAPVLGSKFSLVRQFSNATEALGLSFRLLEAKQNLRVSSSPSLIISHGSKGEFKITEEVIVGEKKERKKGENISVEPIFKEAGLILEVTPYIHEDLSVTLDIRLEVSDFKYRKGITGKESWDFNGQGGSKIGRSLSTKVHVKNQETILIGGLRRSSNRKGENKVPFLGDIPGIRYLFRSESNREELGDMYIKIFVEVY